MALLVWQDWIVLIAALLVVGMGVALWLRFPRKASESSSEGLSPGQRWEVAKIVGAVIGALTAVLGLGGGFLIEQSAAAIKASQVATALSGRTDFVSSVAKKASPLPAGVVAAFDLPGCPEGWIDFVPSHDRMIIGVSPSRKARETGGSEAHVLTVQEMPSHGHALHPEILMYGDHPESDVLKKGEDYPVIRVHKLDRSNVPSPTLVGLNQPHNNMPPYIALYFCKKEAG